MRYVDFHITGAHGDGHAANSLWLLVTILLISEDCRSRILPSARRLMLSSLRRVMIF